MKLIKTSSDLWAEIIRKGKLDLKYYDTNIETKLKEYFGYIETDSLKESLIESKLEIEEFLIAFFEVNKPYSMMFSEILQFFENKSINTTNDSLEVEFDFGKDSKTNKFDLNSFKKQYKEWEDIEQEITVKNWDYRLMWKLNQILYGLNYQSADEKLRNWEFDYLQKKIISNELPTLPENVPSELENEFKEIYSLYKYFVRTLIRRTQDREELGRIRREGVSYNEPKEINEPQNSELLTFAQMDSDHWPLSIIKGLYSQASEIQSLVGYDRIEYVTNLKTNIEEIVSQISSKKVTVYERIEKVFEFLDLPIWKQRHELYAVWVGILTIKILEEKNKVTVHSSDGKLTFSFSGSHLATMTNSIPNLQFWTELRSPFENLIGKSRKKAIQPDYSLVMDPISDINSTVLVIECKQYKKASKSNFSDALIDYANGRPKANVVLVNYAGIPSKVKENLKDEIKRRTFCIENLNPSYPESILAFKDIISKTITSKVKPANLFEAIEEKKSNFIDIRRIEMEWSNVETDMDLAVTIISAENDIIIDYKNPGVSQDFPFVTLKADIRSGGKTPEEIIFHKTLPARYIISASIYGGNPVIENSKIKVSIYLKDKKLIYSLNRLDVKQRWEICEIDTINGEVININKIISELIN